VSLFPSQETPSNREEKGRKNLVHPKKKSKGKEKDFFRVSAEGSNTKTASAGGEKGKRKKEKKAGLLAFRGSLGRWEERSQPPSLLPVSRAGQKKGVNSPPAGRKRKNVLPIHESTAGQHKEKEKEGGAFSDLFHRLFSQTAEGGRKTPPRKGTS